MPTSVPHANRAAWGAWRAALLLAALSFALGALAPRANAAGPFVVTSAADAAPAPPNGSCSSGPSNTCTLREAIQEADFAGTATTITFAAALANATIMLNSALGTLDLTAGSVTIDGGDRNIAISGANLSSGAVLRIQGQGDTIRNLSIKNAPLDGIQIGDYTLGTGGGDNSLIASVRLFGNGGAGVYIKSDSGGGKNNTIRDSVIGASSFAPAACSAAQANLYGVSIDPGVIGARLIANTIICNGTNGISINGAGSGSDPTRTLIQQNKIGAVGGANLRNGAAGVSIYGDARRIDLVSNLISGNQQTGVYITGSATNGITLTGNLIGTSSGGNSAVPNIQAGVQIDGVSGAGVVIGASNRISGNTGAGVLITGSAGVQVKGSYIGLNAAGTAALPNTGYGVQLAAGAHDNIIGGYAPADRNVISGNGFSGVSVGGSTTAHNQIDGNYIGLNVAGTAAVANGRHGVEITGDAHDNAISYNRISGNTLNGVDIEGSATVHNQVDGNYIGLNAAGTAAVANSQHGVEITGDAHDNAVGGSARNVIGGNALNGVDIEGSATAHNQIGGNYIGLNAAGTAAVANSQHGVELTAAAHDNTIGGSTPAARNVISGNAFSGVRLIGVATAHNQVAGNYIGLNATGTAAAPNGRYGVQVINSAHDNIIGGSTAAARNVISGNAYGGVDVEGPGTTNNRVDSNYIGLNAAGTAAVPNGDPSSPTRGAGVAVRQADGNLIGGPGSTSQFISGNRGPGIFIESVLGAYVGRNNRIGVGGDGSAHIGNQRQGVVLSDTINVSVFPTLVAYNGGAGVAVVGSASLGNQALVAENHDNGGLPIDLGDDGPTPNDPGDTDYGPNRLLNYPVITSISGASISGTACMTCTVWIYQASGNPQAPGGGGTMLSHVVADAHGAWNATLPTGLTRYNVSMVACEEPCNLTSSTSEMSPVPRRLLYLPLLQR